jgi:hypothetical protein
MTWAKDGKVSLEQEKHCLEQHSHAGIGSHWRNGGTPSRTVESTFLCEKLSSMQAKSKEDEGQTTVAQRKTIRFKLITTNGKRTITTPSKSRRIQ